MYIELENEGMNINLSQLVGFRKLLLNKGTTFNGEVLADDVFAIEFMTHSNQIAVKFSDRASMEVFYLRCTEIAGAWRNSIMRAGSASISKPVMIPNIRGH